MRTNLKLASNRIEGDYLYISKSSVKKMLKDAGAIRASDPAVEFFQLKMNKLGLTYAAKSVRLAKHARRKTVGPSDIKLAFDNGM